MQQSKPQQPIQNINQEATLKDLLEFPCILNYKVMGYAKPELRDKVLAVLNKYAPDDYPTDVVHILEPKSSRNGTYHALSVTVNATSIEQVEALYKALAAIDIVRAVL